MNIFKFENIIELFKQGQTLHEHGDLPSAKYIYEKVLTINPDHFDSLHLLSIIETQTGNLSLGLDLIKKAIKINPYDSAAYVTIGRIAYDHGQVDIAITNFNMAISFNTDPARFEPYLNKAIALLSIGELYKGFGLYEWRWKHEKFKSNIYDYDKPLWLGITNIKDKTILLYAEQGYGDTIQFCRYVKLVTNLGAKVLLQVPKPLMKLLESLDGVDILIEENTMLPHFDYHCPLMSLPLAFKTEIDTIPEPTPYLSNEKEKLEFWSNRLGKKIKPRIGIVWSGSVNHENDNNRSLILKQLLCYLPDVCEYVCLQKEIREVDLDILANSNIRHFCDEILDFSDTSALCELMDVVITVDTCTAHLAGAIGKQTWVLLPFVADWRWLIDKEYTPWYNSVKLYRQSQIKEWDSVLARISTDLLNLH